MNRYFYEPERGENVWEYFWEPVMGVSSADLTRLIEEGRVSAESVHTFTTEQSRYWHVADPERIATFWITNKPSDRNAWMQDKRRLGREYVRRFIRVRPEIEEKAATFAAEHFGPMYRFGVHIRGTDWSYAEPTRPEQYFEAIEALVAERGLTEFGVFVATEQEQFVDAFRDRYDERVVVYSSARSSNHIAPFKRTDVSPYKKGEDVLIDILLLSFRSMLRLPHRPPSNYCRAT